MTLEKIIIVDSVTNACVVDHKDKNEYFYTRSPSSEHEWLCGVHTNTEEYFYKAVLNHFHTPNNSAKTFRWLLRNKSEVPSHVLAAFTLIK